MTKFVLKRLLGAAPNVIGVVIVTFLLTRALPGDPAAFFAGPAATREAVEQVRASLGLDKPMLTGFYLIDSLAVHDGELFVAALKQLILPAVTLGLFVLAPIARMTRASMLGVLSSDFVRTARAAGLSGPTVLYTYAFRNALL